jgi:hypothetical protein
VTEGAFPVKWIIDKELAASGGMQISYDRQSGINPAPVTG